MSVYTGGANFQDVNWVTYLEGKYSEVGLMYGGVSTGFYGVYI